MRRLLIPALLLAACGTDEPTPTPEPGKPPLRIEPGGAPTGEAPTDAGPPPGAITSDDCDKVSPSDPVPEGAYLTGKLACGDVITAHTGGGARRFDTKFYERHQCTPATTNHDGGEERIYELLVPDGDKTVDVRLDTPCANLDLAAIRVNGAEAPTIDSAVAQCEMWPKDGTKAEKVHLVSKVASRWLVVVEGRGDEEGPFTLSVTCRDGLH